MRKTIQAIAFVAAILMINAGTAYGDHWKAGQDVNAIMCFEETETAARGAEPSTLSTVFCTRALRADVLTREDQSAILFNRGLIQRAQGNLVAAQASFERSVHLSRTIDKRNLALAEVARKLGDYAVAFEQYDLLAGSAFAAETKDLEVAMLARRDETLQMLDLTLHAAIETPDEEDE